ALNLKEELKELEAFKFNFPEMKGYAIRGDYRSSLAVPLFDSVPVIVTAYGIDKGNVEMYRFRVLQNKEKEIVGWRRVMFISPAFMHYRYNVDG
ncbi:hypothetical protein ABTP94_18215, partial [Acinetobacter baumannii]